MKRKNCRLNLGRFIAGLVAAVCTLMFVHCDEEGTFNPIGEETRFMLITELTATPNIISTNGESIISGRVIDQHREPFSNRTVAFEASLGTVAESDTTDDTGRFTANYRAGDETGIDTIYIHVENLRSYVTINISGVSPDLSVNVNPVSVLANGVDSVTVRAAVIGQEGNIGRIPVRFESSAGNFNGQRVTYTNTDADGKADVKLTAPSSNSTIVATVTASIEFEESSPTGSPTPQIRKQRLLRRLRTSDADVEASASVTFRGVSIEATATPPLIPGDGQATAQISARLKEVNNQAVPGAMVTFSALHGSIPVSAYTNQSGIATVFLTSASLPGETDLVITHYGPALADSVQVQYAAAVGSISLSTDPGSYLADGMNTTEIIAHVLGGTGQPAPGIPVRFWSETGMFSTSAAITDENGRGSVTFIGPASTIDQEIVVYGEVIEAAENPSVRTVRRSTSGIASDGVTKLVNRQSAKNSQVLVRDERIQSLVDSVVVIGRGVRLRLTADPDSIIARDESVSSITIEVFETTSGNPVPNDTVRIATSLGSIPGMLLLNNQGQVITNLTAGNETGRALVIGMFGTTHRDTTTVDLLPTIGRLEATPDKYSMLAGGIDSIEVTVNVLDALGGAAPHIPVYFENDFQPGVINRIYTDDSGEAFFTVVSAVIERDTTMLVSVSASDLQRELNITVQAVNRRISADPDSLSVGSDNPVEVTFQAFERSTNRPVVGRTVWFSAFGGVVQPSAELDENGTCSTTFLVGDTPGSAWVIGQLGILSADSARLELVEPIAAIHLDHGRGSILGDGLDTTMITARVVNALAQPAPDIWVQFDVQDGSIFPHTAQTNQDGLVSAVYSPSAVVEDRTITIFAEAFEPDLFAGIADRKPAGGDRTQSVTLNSRSNRTIRSTRSVLPSVRESSHAPNNPAPMVDESDQFEDSLSVNIRGVTLELRTEPRAIRANGYARSGVNIHLIETTSGTAIANANVRLGATLGAIRASGVTNLDGTFVDSLTAGIATGTSIVRGIYGEGITAIDSVVFTPDPTRLNLVAQLIPDRCVADGETEVTLRCRVIENNGSPAVGISVRFTVEDPLTVLIDPDEYRSVTRWENTFRVEDVEEVDALRLYMQLSGVNDPTTRISINRTAIDQVALPRNPLWGETVLTLPIDNLINGINRIEIIGGDAEGNIDRFSVAGVRLAMVGSHYIGESETDDNGWAETGMVVDRCARNYTVRAALNEDVNRFDEAELTLLSGDPTQVLVSTQEDTLLASGVEETEILVLVTDENGNPVSEGHVISFTVEPVGRIEPAETQTLGDGAASSRFFAPAMSENVQCTISARSADIEGTCSLVLNGALINLTADSYRMLADGYSTVNLSARISNTNGAAVPNRRVWFSTSRGAVTPVAVTDNNGIAAAILTAPDNPDTAIVIATLGPDVVDTILVAYAQLVESVEIASQSASILGNGIDSTRLVISVVDGVGEGAEEVEVNVSVDKGLLSDLRVYTDAEGHAELMLYSSPSIEDDSIHVIASAERFQSSDTLYVRLRGITVAVETDPDSLAANGVSTARVTTRVSETASGNPVEAGTIRFSTNRGSISARAELDENGVAEATYTAPLDVGSATITARYGSGLQDGAELVLVDRAAAMELEITPGSILADGAKTASIQVRMTDPWGGPAPQELISLNFEGPCTVTPLVGYNNHNGEFNAVVRGEASAANDYAIITAEARGGLFRHTEALTLRGVTITSNASPVLIPGDGQSTSDILTQVRETTSGHAVVGDTVYFSTTAGIIGRYAILDENGEARATLRSSAEPVIAQVVSSFGNRLTDTTQVAFAGLYSYLGLSADRINLLADGSESTQLTATLRDTLGNPVSNQTISFSRGNDLGSLSIDTAVTDANGRGRISFISEALTVDSLALVEAFIGNLADTVSIRMRGVSLSVQASPDSIPANGYATSTITAQVQETTSGNPVGNRQVYFSVNAGVIPASRTTDENGNATVQLRAPRNPGRATVTTRFGDTLRAQTTIDFVTTVGSLELTSSQPTVLGDGIDNAVVTATVYSQVGNPVPNVRVVFGLHGGGWMTPVSVLTDNNGEARSVYTGFATGFDSTITIDATAQAGPADGVSMRILGITTALTASPPELPANGRAESTIRLSAYETTAHNPVIGQIVSFSADRGSIGHEAVLDNDGEAITTFTAPSVAGDAVITAILGDSLVSMLNLPCNSSLPTHVALSMEPRSISVSGIGQVESAILTAVITDARGYIVPDGSQVLLRVLPDIGVRFANDQDTLLVRAEDGIAEAQVTAGDEVGSVIFKAEYNGELLATGGELVVHSGPPYRLTVSADLGIIHNPADGFSAFPVAASVADRFGNPVADSTVVHFSVSPDTLAQITAIGYTTNGLVYQEVVVPVNAQQYRSGIWVTYDDENAGEELYVRAAAGGGDARDSSQVILPGALQGGDPHRIELSIDDNDLVADGASSTILTVRVMDSEDLPVADGNEVRLTTELGSVQSPRYTAGGEITSTYRSGRITGTDMIRISVSDVRDSVYINLLPGIPASVEISVDRNELRANGIDATFVHAQVRDRFNNTLRAGQWVTFSTGLGEITLQAQTDSTGTATARLISGMETGRSFVNATISNITAQLAVNFTSGLADGIELVSINRNAVGVRGSGSPETSTLIFMVHDDRGVPVDENHQVMVDFQLDGPERVINPALSSEDSVAYLDPLSIATDNQGQAAVTLNSGFFAGALEITASVGDTISGQAIAVAVHGGPPDDAHFTLLPDRCVVTGILGTPPDSVSLTATIGDRFSNPVVPGTIVRFSSTGGVIEGSARTDSSGVCQARLTTVQPHPVEGIDTIYAQTLDWQNQEINAETYVLVTGYTIVTFDTADGWAIPYGEFRDFIIMVADSFEHPLTAGTTIQISAIGRNAQGDEVEGIILTGDGIDDPVELIECSQRMIFRVRMFNYVSGLDGASVTLIVDVESANGNLESELRGSMMGQVLSTSSSRVSVNPDELVADGGTQAEVTITLYDVIGISIPNVRPDDVMVSVTAGDPVITQPAAQSDDYGRMTAQFVGRSVGSGNVQVRVDGQLLDAQPAIVFIPGPPSRISVQVLDRILEVGGDTTTVSVFVSDQNGNPTVDGTVVEFIADDGTFTPSAAVTVNGVAGSLFHSGITAGPSGFSVLASYRGTSVQQDVSNIEFLPGPPSQISVTADAYSIQVGSETEISIAAEDQFGNPVAANTEFNLSIEPVGRGSIAPNSVRVDELGLATARYTAGTTAGQTARVVAESDGNSGQSSLFVFTAGPPGRVTLVAAPNDLEVGGNVNLTATVVDAYGNPVSDTTRVQFTIEPAVGTVTPSVINTQNGIASSVVTGVTDAGAVEAVAQAGDVIGSARLTYNVGPLTRIQVNALPSQVGTGRSSTVTATATDRYGNPVPGSALNFILTTNPGGNCILQHNQRVTGEDGTAQTIFTAGNTAGSAIITVQWDDDDDIEGSTFVDIIVEGG